MKFKLKQSKGGNWDCSKMIELGKNRQDLVNYSFLLLVFVRG